MPDKPAATVTGSGEAHYYCVNQRCQFVAHVKPPERKCPLCGSQVWEEGSSVEEFKTKQRPRCFACEGPLPTPPASPTVTLERFNMQPAISKRTPIPGMVPNPEGEWVKYEDALTLLRAAERQK